MMIGWQEIIAIGIVAVAVLIVMRRSRHQDGKNGCGGGGCGCSSTTRDAPAGSHGVKITEVHTLRIDRTLTAEPTACRSAETAPAGARTAAPAGGPRPVLPAGAPQPPAPE